MPHQCTTCGQTFADGSKEMLSGCPGCGGNKFQYLPSDVLEEGGEPVPDSAAEPPEAPDEGVAETVGRAATTVRDYVANRRSDDAAPAETEGSSGTASSADADTASETPEPTEEPATTHETQVDAQPEPQPESQSEPRSESHPEATAAGTDDVETDAEALPPEADEEDHAQASARGEMVDPSTLPDETVGAGTAPPAEGRVVKEPDDDGAVQRPDLEDLRAELNEQFESIRIVAPGQYELNLMELYDREEHIIALQEDGRYVIQVPESWREADDE